jgi:hypothetical protein
MLKGIVTLLVSCALAFGAEAQSNPRHSRKLWWVSVAVLAAASVLDAHSSWGRQELNPLLRGPNDRFGARSAGIKSAMVGGSVAAQWFILRHHPKVEKPAAAVNCAIAASALAAVVHNSK